MWDQWTAWSGCDATCGGGAKTRSRICQNGDAGDIGCHIGQTSETDVCNNQDCPGLLDNTLNRLVIKNNFDERGRLRDSKNLKFSTQKSLFLTILRIQYFFEVTRNTILKF